MTGFFDFFANGLSFLTHTSYLCRGHRSSFILNDRNHLIVRISTLRISAISRIFVCRTFGLVASKLSSHSLKDLENKNCNLFHEYSIIYVRVSSEIFIYMTCIQYNQMFYML